MKIWRNRKIDIKRATEIAKKYNINMILAVLYLLRFKEETEKYIENNIIEEDPYILPDMDKAVDRILEAIENQEKVLVYADYDTDGATSATILTKFLKSLEVDTSYYIPNRIKEGYGLNTKAIETFKKLGYDLIITVDTGIAAIEEAKFAKKLGLDLIITDHHEVQTEIPDAIAVVDQKRLDNYPVENICGCMVAYKLIQAISISIGLEEKEYLKYLPIVAIGTIGDVMPLLGENRLIVQKGLEMLKNNHEYLDEIDKYLLLKLFSEKTITSEIVAYYISPLLNASGRLGNDTATMFLTSESIQEIDENYIELSLENEKRKQIVSENLSLALKMIEENKKDIEKSSVILLTSKEFHEGVVGILASKVLEQTGKTTIILTENENGFKGSGRAKGINLFELILPFKDKLDAFGGHSAAIGLSVSNEYIEEFKNEISKIQIDEIQDIIEYDMCLNLKDLSVPLLETFKKLEPFGKDNPTPIFMFKKCRVSQKFEYEKATKLVIEQDDFKMNALTFDIDKLKTIQKGDEIHIIGKPTINTFNNQTNIVIHIEDVYLIKY